MGPAGDLREKVMSAGLALIEEAGVQALSMREVARRAGVSHQAPYHHFGDKAAILAALAAEGFAEMAAAMRRAAGRETTPQKRVEAIGRAYIRFALARPALFKLMFQSELVAIEAHDKAQSQAMDAFGFLVSLIEEAAGERSPMQRQALVFAAWSLVHGVSTLILENRLQQRLPPGVTPEAAADAVLQVFGELFDAPR